DCNFGQRNTFRGWIEIEKEKEIVRASGITIRGNEVRVSSNRFIERLQRLEQCRSDVGRINIAVDDGLGLKVKLERLQVLSRALFNLCLLLRRKLGLQLRNDRLGELALNGEQISRTAIVGLSPNMSVRASVDQFRIDTEAITSALD